MKPIREWLRSRRDEVVVRPMISRVSLCGTCGRVFVNEDAVPNHLCVGRDYSATYSVEVDATVQRPEFTIIPEEEKK